MVWDVGATDELEVDMIVDDGASVDMDLDDGDYGGVTKVVDMDVEPMKEGCMDQAMSMIWNGGGADDGRVGMRMKTVPT